MSRFLLSLCIGLALLLQGGCTAQAGTRVITPEVVSEPVLLVARVEIYRDSAGEFRWSLVALNRLIIADSAEGYATAWNARRAAETVQATIARARIVDIGLRKPKPAKRR